MTMHKSLIVLASLACIGHGRRVQTSETQVHVQVADAAPSSQSFAEVSAAFTPSVASSRMPASKRSSAAPRVPLTSMGSTAIDGASQGLAEVERDHLLALSGATSQTSKVETQAAPAQEKAGQWWNRPETLSYVCVAMALIMVLAYAMGENAGPFQFLGYGIAAGLAFFRPASASAAIEVPLKHEPTHHVLEESSHTVPDHLPGPDKEISMRDKLVDDPIKEGLANLEMILKNDMANRYQAKDESSNFILQCERWFANYLGMKYALSLNSGGIAISLGLEAMKQVLFPEDRIDEIRVYSNAFTFHAVPSACVVGGFRETLKLIEATPELVIDLDHFEACIQEDLESGKFAKGKMILVLSYMRGRVPDMNRVLDICNKYDIQILEDCAHGYGVTFDGKMCGSFGVVSTISMQANKIINTGEGGMVFTNNDDMQAFFIFSAGSYEELWRKHAEFSPPEEVCLKHKYTCVNKSVRLTNIQAALMHPQLLVMDDRIKQHNSMYDYLIARTGAKLEEICGEDAHARVEFIGQASELVGPVYDSLQIRILDKDGKASGKELDGLDAFLKAMQARKYSIAKFSDPANARNYLSWQYLKSGDILPDALPQTTKVLANVCDLRLLCFDTEVEMEQLATGIAECLKEHVFQ